MENPLFLAYVFRRSDPETLLVPLSRELYHAVTSSDAKAQHSLIYVLLVLCLVLTHNETFNDALQAHVRRYANCKLIC